MTLDEVTSFNLKEVVLTTTDGLVFKGKMYVYMEPADDYNEIKTHVTIGQIWIDFEDIKDIKLA